MKYLDGKYGESGYEVSDLELEEAYLYGDSNEKLNAYFIMEKGKYNRTIYAIAEKGTSDYTYFDNLQSREIKQSFQNELNAITGRSEGKLLWNSSFLSLYHCYSISINILYCWIMLPLFWYINIIPS